MTRRLQLVAYVALVAVMGFLFWRVTEAMDRIERESQVRTYVLCQESNDAREQIRRFLADAYLAGRDGISVGEQAILDLAAARFPEIECPPEP